MPQKESFIRPLPPESSVPEHNLIEKTFQKAESSVANKLENEVKPSKLKALYQKLFDKVKILTRPSTMKTKEGKSPEGTRQQTGERSLATRRIRKRLLDQFQATPKENTEDRRAILDEAHERDRIATEYLHQQEVHVTLEKLGEQSSRFTILRTPESKRDLNLPLIVLIPGISNDIDPVGTLAQSLAFSGRDVVVIGYPESTLGTVSEQFAAATKITGTFWTHAEYYKGAITEILSNPDLNLNWDSYELWSHSTGGPIGATMLEDTEFQQSISNAVFLSPGSVVDQSAVSLLTGLIKEIAYDLKKDTFVDLARYSIVPPGPKGEMKDRKDLTFSSLLTAIRKKHQGWDTTKLSSGGKVVFWSGDRDTVTKTNDATTLGSGDGQVLVRDEAGSHLTSLIQPEKVIEQVDAALGR